LLQCDAIAVVHLVPSGAVMRADATSPRTRLLRDPPRTQRLINGYKEPVDCDFVAPSDILRTDGRFGRSSEWRPVSDDIKGNREENSRHHEDAATLTRRFNSRTRRQTTLKMPQRPRTTCTWLSRDPHLEQRRLTSRRESLAV